MSNDNKREKIDLDSILSEINTSIKKEVSKTNSVKSQKSPNKTTAKKTSSKKTTPKKTTKPQAPKEHRDHKIDSAFAKSAKIIEHAVEDDDDIFTTHAVRFIAVTASEVVEEEIKPIVNNQNKDISQTHKTNSIISVNCENDTTEQSPISLDFASPKSEPSPDVARENNYHIKKLRDKRERPHMTKRRKTVAIIGIIMTALVIVGIISLVINLSNATYRAIDKTNLKEELAQEIFPFVIIDIPEFEDVKFLDNSAIISSAIWAFIIDGPDKTKYTYDDLGSIYIPDVDIEVYIRRLFGNDIPIKHASVENSSVLMFYDPETKMYSVEATPKILPYRPQIDTIDKNDDIYTLGVSYIRPDAMWNFQDTDNNKIEEIDKTMEFILKKNKDSYQIISVEFISVTGYDTSEPTATSELPVEGELDAPIEIAKDESIDISSTADLSSNLSIEDSSSSTNSSDTTSDNSSESE